nr:integrase, catalytic region, zinc finger, CCHC-type, peptidase aspartic, catalytic [Tanacetum cinerariifolium]
MMGSKNKNVVITSDPLALIAEKTKVRKSKEKVVVSSDSKGSGSDDFSELKKITALLAKAFNRRKFYSKPTNNNLRTSSSSQSANKKQEYVKSDDKQVEKKDDEKKRDMSRVKCYNCKKEGHFAKGCKKAMVNDYEYYKTKMLLAKKDKDEQVPLAKDQAWMESSSDSDQEINANMVFMAQIEKVFSDSEASSSSSDEKIYEVSYYLSKSESKSEYETSEYYDNSTNYGLFMKNDDNQEIFHDAIESASENFIGNHIDSQKDYDKSDVDHNDSEEKDHLVDKLRWMIYLMVLADAEESVRDAIGFEYCPDLSLEHRFGMFKAYDGSMTIKKVYYVKGLGHNLFSVGKFCDKGLEVAFRKSRCFVQNEDGVDLLAGDRSSNLFTIALNEVASNSSTCLRAKASSSQSWLWHQRLSHLNFTTINYLVKNNLVQGLPKMKFEKDHLCSACEQGKIH